LSNEDVWSMESAGAPDSKLMKLVTFTCLTPRDARVERSKPRRQGFSRVDDPVATANLVASLQRPRFTGLDRGPFGSSLPRLQ
jgi:hypothetical protein